MDRNFQLGQSNEVIHSGKVYDLHNDYLPTAIFVDPERNTLRVIFKRLADDENGASVVLQFRDLHTLEFGGNFGASNAAGLDEMGYKDIDDYNYDWLSTESQSKESDHLVLRFDGGATIRVYCATAEIVENSTLQSLEL